MEDIDQLSSEVGALENEIEEIELQMKEVHNKAQATVGRSAFGGINILFGVFGLIFFSKLWYLWAILLAIGSLAYLSAKAADRRYKREITGLQEQISVIREQLSTKQAHLATFLHLR